MSNKRTLKRTINTVCDELFAECVAASLYSGTKEKDNWESLLMSVVALRNDFINRISHPQPGMEQKLYYRQVLRNFSEEVSELADHINHAF